MPRGNSFTFLRLAFALVVVFAHSFALGGFGDDPLARFSGGQVNAGSVAVMCFFIVSGFLITGSAVRQPSIFQFALNRVARIAPGFWAVQLLTVFVLAPAITLARYGDRLGYWDSIVVGPYSAMDYLILNADFRILQYPITNLFSHNPAGGAVNGSLWSLAPEVTCYLYLGALTVVGGLRWKYTAPLLFAAGYVFHNAAMHQPDLGVQVAQVLENGWIYGTHLPLFRSVFLAFLAGMTCYQFRDRLRWRGWLAAVAVLALVVSCRLGAFELIWPLTLPYLVLYLAHRLPFERVEQWGDFSYGIYIYAFPLQQCLALNGVPRFGFIAFFAASTVLAVLAGMASWFALERPVLNWTRTLSRRFRSTVKPPEVACQMELLPEKH
ncbi:MAG: acyltransferase [Chthoniobacter sp.]